MTEKTFLLVLSSPGTQEMAVRCDAVSFTVPDGIKGKNGGSVGIRPGHINAMMALASGKITARFDGRDVLSCTVDGGFAMVEGHRVTVLSDGLQIEQINESFRSTEA